MKDKKPTTTNEVAYTGVIPNKPLRFLWYTAKPFWPWILLGGLLNVSTQLLNTYTAIYIGNFADAGVIAESPEEFAAWAWTFVLLMSAVFLTFRLSGFVGIQLVLRQHRKAFQDVKQYLLGHSHTYFINRFAGTLTGKIFHAGDRSSELLLMTYYGFIRLTVGLTSTGVAIALFSGWLALIYFAILALTLFINLQLVKRRRPLVVSYAAASSYYRGQVTDVVTNIQTVRQFSGVKYENKHLNETLDDRVTKDAKQWTAGEWNHVVNNLLTVVMLSIMVGGVYWMLVNDLATMGAMVTVMILMYRVSGIIVDLGDWMNRLIRVYGEVEEGLDEILTDHEIVDAPGAKKLKAKRGQIAWNDVSFEFGENAVFKDFNLTIKPGQRVGLVGHSGAGKTTFVSLLLRQHDLDAGTIEIDEQNIAKVTQNSLRDAIAVVPQEPLLFHRSISENIAYGNPKATKKEIEAVAKKAQVHGFVTELEHGYDTLVGERGVKLSGGQKQRIAIARAMLKDAPILILDEATSALDSESEVEIQKALHKLMSGKTVVAVAHRLSTLREMDRIIVLENGKVIEDGSHDALVNYGGVYAKLWEHQAGGFLQD